MLSKQIVPATPSQSADEYPNAQVTGFDLSPIQPEWVPPNVHFEVLDADEDWSYRENHFDLVHTRFMNGFSLKSWPHFYQQAFPRLKPRAWVENQEFDSQIMSDDNTIPPNSKALEWANLCKEGIEALSATGRCYPEKLAQHMRDAGFINVSALSHKMPVGPWSKDQMLKQAGMCGLIAWRDGLRGLSGKLFTDGLGGVMSNWSYWPAFVIIGQKPHLEPETEKLEFNRR